jgi:8-oxo-dGTP pyrophosphatase MutT (NUDIX family)
VSGAIRVVALGAVRRGEELLVSRETTPARGAPFYRFLGGGVEFGEHSRVAVVREFDEELGVTFADPTHVGTFESVFTVDGETEHELWRVYDGRIVEDWPYETDSFRFVEPDDGTEHTAEWVPVENLRADETTFYTPAVLDTLGV